MIEVQADKGSGVECIGGEWVVTSHQAGRLLLEQSGYTARSPLAALLPKLYGPPSLDDENGLLCAIFQQLTFADESDHARLRKALEGPLKRYSVRLKPFIQQKVQSLIEAARPRAEVDLEEEFAAPLAICTLARLLGWPDHTVDVQEVAEWSRSLADLTTSHAMSQAIPKVQKMATAFRRLLANKQAIPTDDLTSVVAASPAFRSEAERVVTLMVIFSAGTSTVITALVNGLSLLLSDTKQQARFRAELLVGQLSLTRLAEEFVRCVTPTKYLRRWTTEEVMLGGERLPPGCPVQIQLSAMNHDAERFPHPNALDWHRSNTHEQAGFGFGVHVCPGAPLARLALRLALEALLPIPGLRLVAPPSGWSHNQNQLRAHGVRVAFQHEGVRL